jgi:hypothetical protein
MRAVTHADDPSAAAAYFESFHAHPSRARWGDDARRDRAIADLELEDEMEAGPELAGFEGED